jgi:hypothetical protein
MSRESKSAREFEIPELAPAHDASPIHSNTLRTRTKEFTFCRTIISALFAAMVLFVLIPLPALCQSDSLDIVRYTPPKGWTKTPKEGAVAYSHINESTKVFCVLTLYASTPGTGSPSGDFTNRWNELVVRTLGGEANPKTETQTSDGWQVVAGAAAVEIDGVKSYAILTVYSGFGKMSSILAIFNDQSYLAQLDAFAESVKLDKTKVAASPNSSAPANANSAAHKALSGRWAQSTSGTRGLDPSGNVLNSGYYKTEYTFSQDGSYTFKAERWGGYIKSNEFWMTAEIGVFTVDGNLLTVSPTKSTMTLRSREGAVLKTQSNPLERTTYRWNLHYFEGIKQINLILQTDAETRRDGTFGSNSAFPKSYFFSQEYKPEWKFD